MSVTIGSQKITPNVKDLGNTYILDFDVQIERYKDTPTNQKIHVTMSCNKYKDKFVGKPPNVKVEKVEKTVQECVDEWVTQHKNIYKIV